MIRNAYIINNRGDHKNDKIHWRPTAIFKDNKSQQVIFIALGGYPRPVIWHFYANKIPDELIQRYSSFVKRNKINIDVTKKIKDSIKNATIVQKQYFTTKKNFRLGTSRKEAVSIYGELTKETKTNYGTKLIWDYYGLHTTGNNVKNHEELLKNNKFGFSLEVLFRNDKARFIYIRNEIP